MTRDDGKKQWAFKGKPLYYWIKDQKPGDAALPDLPTRATQSDALELRDFARSLARLPEEQREVLLLVALEDLSYEDTAKILDVPVGTVMSRLSRGRERLRALLSGDEPAETPLKVVK